MLNCTDASISQIIVHHIGDHKEDDRVIVSTHPTTITDESVELVLKTYFLSHFKTDFMYSFIHPEDLEMNEVYSAASQIFDNPNQLAQTSAELANLLYSKSTNPNIKSGEFYVVFFKDITFNDEFVDAIGLFKSENKDTYIKVFNKGDNYAVESEAGINIKKVDKGCLIINSDRETGFQVAIIDTINRNNEALYWKEDFLGVAPRENEYYQTSQLFDICKAFGNDVLTNENKINKTDQVTFLKNAEDFFAKNDIYDTQTFSSQVIGNEELANAFTEYKGKYETQRQIAPIDQFEISSEAVKHGKKYFRSVIKLDKNFHIYVHANPDFIEKGFDEHKGRNFYKLYFINEE